jgi:hypothetical protein
MKRKLLKRVFRGQWWKLHFQNEKGCEAVKEELWVDKMYHKQKFDLQKQMVGMWISILTRT